MNKFMMFAALAVCCASPLTVSAQAWPTKSISLIVPGVPGTGSDVIARELAQKLAGPLGQSIVVENRAGASGNIGTDYAAKAKPDGYTLFISSTSGVINQFTNKPQTRLERDFVAVALASSTPFFLAVPATLPVNSVAELIAEAKRRPGQLNYAGFTGGIISFLGEMLKSSANIDIVQVPYKNTPAAQVDVIAGRIQIWFSTSGALTLATAGRVKVLATTGHQRSALAPNVPTMKELGYPSVTLEATYYVMAPVGTPRPIVERLSKEIYAVMSSADTVDRLGQKAMAPTKALAPDAHKFIMDELKQWEKLIADTAPQKS